LFPVALRLVKLLPPCHGKSLLGLWAYMTLFPQIKQECNQSASKNFWLLSINEDKQSNFLLPGFLLRCRVLMDLDPHADDGGSADDDERLITQFTVRSLHERT